MTLPETSYSTNIPFRPGDTSVHVYLYKVTSTWATVLLLSSQTKATCSSSSSFTCFNNNEQPFNVIGSSWFDHHRVRVHYYCRAQCSGCYSQQRFFCIYLSNSFTLNIVNSLLLFYYYTSAPYHLLLLFYTIHLIQ